MALTPVVAAKEEGSIHIRDSGRAASTVVGLLGLAFVVVGLTEIVLLWVPMNAGSALWEVSTYGGSLDRMPMVALGMGLLALAAVWSSSRRAARVRLVSALFLALALLLIAVAILYGTSVPAVLHGVSPQAAARIRSVLLQAAVEACVYPLVFLGVGIVLWRSVRMSARR